MKKIRRFRIREKHVMNLLIDVPLLWSKDKKEILTKIIERLLDLHVPNLEVLANVLLHFVILGKVFMKIDTTVTFPIPSSKSSNPTIAHNYSPSIN